MLRSLRGSGLDPDHVYSLFRRGDRSALFLYLASIRGAAENPHCHGIWQAGWALGTPPTERHDLRAGSSPIEEHALGTPPPERIPCDSRKSAHGGPLEVDGLTGVSCDSRKPAHAAALEFDGSTGWYEDEDELIKLAEYARWQAKSSSLCVSHVSGNAYSVPQKEKLALGGNKLPAKEDKQTPENVSAKGGYKHHMPEHKGSEKVLINSCEEKGQSLTEHPYVSVEVAEAEVLCAISRRDSRRKKIINHRAELQLLRLNMQRVDALSKEEKTSNIKKMRLLSEKIKGEEKMYVLDAEDVHTKQDILDRARLRSSGA